MPTSMNLILPQMLYDENELPFITTDILIAELDIVAEHFSKLGDLWAGEVCRIARDHIAGVRIENRWLRVKNGYE